MACLCSLRRHRAKAEQRTTTNTEVSMSENTEIKFVNNGKGQATRYDDKTWERYKPIILTKYEAKTLETVRKEMEDEYQFVVTYVSRRPVV
jgi:hypothetical protein